MCDPDSISSHLLANIMMLLPKFAKEHAASVLFLWLGSKACFIQNNNFSQMSHKERKRRTAASWETSRVFYLLHAFIST